MGGCEPAGNRLAAMTTQRPSGVPMQQVPPLHGGGPPRPLEVDPSVAVKGNVDANAVLRIGYVPAFDGLRGVGAVLVVAVHLFMVVIPANRELPKTIPGTFVFMDMFFVLSGFLITALLLREQTDRGRISLFAFYRRRAMRLLPALYTLLAVHWLYASIVGFDPHVEHVSLLLAAFYSLNWQMKTVFSPVADGLTQLWSLSMEEQFYLVWPLLVIAFFNMRRRLTVVVLSLVVAISVVAIRRAFLWEGVNWLRLYTHTDTRADSLLVGALLAFLWVHGKLPRRGLVPAAWSSLVFLTLCVLFARLDRPFAYLGGFTLMAVAWAVVILAAMESDWAGNRLLRFGPIMLLGEVSYAIYLWHVPVQVAVARHGQTWSVVDRVVVSLVVTTIFVWLSWVLVEKPCLRWKDHIERRHLGVTRRATTP